MSKKYYFLTQDSEMAYPLSYFKDLFKGEEVELFEGIPYKTPNMMWCKEHLCAGDTGNCGNECKEYTPKNGKNGCCKHYSRTFYEPNETSTKFQF